MNPAAPASAARGAYSSASYVESTSTTTGLESVHLGEDLPGRVEPADAGEIHVHEHEVGTKLTSGGHRILPGLDLADHLEPVGELDHRPRDVAEGRLVIDDQHSHAHLDTPTLQR